MGGKKRGNRKPRESSDKWINLDCLMCRKDIRELWRNNTGFWQMHIGEWKSIGGTNKRRGKGT